MLNHAESDTTRVHYATAPPFQSVYSLAGFNKFGNDFDVIRALARKELEDSFMGLVFALVPWLQEAWEYYMIKKVACDNTKRAFLTLVLTSCKCFVESAAQFRIDNIHSDLEFFNYHPFNSTQFEEFTCI